MSILKSENRFDDIDLTISNIYNSIIHSIIDDSNIELWSEETDNLYESFKSLLESDIYMNDSFKNHLNMIVLDIMSDVSDSAFEKGFKMGLSLLRNILTAEIPTIQVKEPKAKTKVPIAKTQTIIDMKEQARQLNEFIANHIMFLSETQKRKAQEYIITLLCE